MSAAYDCQKCGACCAEFDVLLSGTEIDRFERRPALIVLTILQPVGNGPAWRFLRRDAHTGRCAALAGELGDCGCTIYAERPALCRAFLAGSPDCLAARRKHGFGADPDCEPGGR